MATQVLGREGTRPRVRPLRALVRLAALALAALVALVAVTAAQVWSAAGRDDRGPADAIVVLGAAQYDGRPSPVFRARLDHALGLYRDGVAPWLAVTGGAGPGDDSTEAAAAARYLQANGVPRDAILPWETSARTTYESIVAVERILDGHGLGRAILVSDPTHALRLGVVADEVGMDAGVSPTRTSPAGRRTRLEDAARETAAVAFGRLVGHRRLPSLERALRGAL